MAQKILLVGDSRICRQVAYVMDWQNYMTIEKLIDVKPYRDYKIVVCAFKRKSKRLVKIKDKTRDITYLDAICCELDKNDTSHHHESKKVDVPLWRRIIDRLKTGEVLIAFLRRHRRRYGTLRSRFWLKLMPAQELTLSELFLKVLYSKPTAINCTRMWSYSTLFKDGNLYGCCPPWTPPMGNVQSASLATIYNSRRARIIKLSALNKSFCLCDLKKCEFVNNDVGCKNSISTIYQSNNLPEQLEIAVDESCNLRCPSCRLDYCTMNDNGNQQIKQIMARVKSSEWLESVPQLIMSGVGEIFYSPTLLPIMAKDIERKQIHILSNGTLFNRKNWELLKNKYQQIDVEISVDAATAVTYQKIRGGDFKQVMQNLEMLGKLRQQGEIRYFELNFVVQKDNYREMADFVRLAKKLFVDRVHFTHLNNWGTFTYREYRQKCLITRHKKLHRALRRVLRDPILQDPIVDLRCYAPYLKNFARRFPQSLRPLPPYAW